MLSTLLGFGPQPSLAQQAPNDPTSGEINLGTVGSAGQTTYVGPLSSGKALFWSGPIVEQSFLLSSEQCDLPSSGCYDYQIRIAEPAARLRVAIDHPNLGDVFNIRLFDPSGADVTDTTQLQRSAGGPRPIFAIWSHETFAKHPAPGVWTARVAPLNTNNSAFRMRAMLEEEPKKMVLAAPSCPTSKWRLHTSSHSARAEKPDEQPEPSCLDSEAKYLSSGEAWRCLRFSAGPQNVGEGRFEVVFPPGEGVASEGTAQQRIYFSDGTYEDRVAGTYTYHREHGHFHHTAIGGYELLRVKDPSTGALTSVSEGPKIGTCMGDTFIAQWRARQNDLPADTSRVTACAGSPSGGVMGLTKGWGDIYPWWVEGNFVPFPNNAAADGLYVVRVVSDTRAEGTATFAETNETDNTSYAYISVTGTDIDVLERGQGTSPWDPAKTITLDGRPSNPDCPALATQRGC